MLKLLHEKETNVTLIIMLIMQTVSINLLILWFSLLCKKSGHMLYLVQLDWQMKYRYAQFKIFKFYSDQMFNFLLCTCSNQCYCFQLKPFVFGSMKNQEAIDYTLNPILPRFMICSIYIIVRKLSAIRHLIWNNLQLRMYRYKYECNDDVCKNCCILTSHYGQLQYIHIVATLHKNFCKVCEYNYEVLLVHNCIVTKHFWD